MISDDQLPELEAYRRLEDELPVRQAPEFARLVVYRENDDLPVHRWFKFKEGYSGNLLGALLLLHPNNRASRLRLLDCYAGSGTTLVSAQQFAVPKIDAIGIERNPFLHFVASAKLRYPEADPGKLLRLGQRVLKTYQDRRVHLPSLSSISTGRCINVNLARKVIAFRDAILEVEQPYRDLLLLGLASAIEELSNVRKDGRALRIIDRKHTSVRSAVQARWETIASDIRTLMPAGKISCKTFMGDGRRPIDTGVEPGSIDLVLTSPPYPNNIDYSEVYKLELWLLGFITDGESFLALRKATLRSHPTSDLDRGSEEFLSWAEATHLRETFAPLLNKFDKSEELWRKKLLLGYFDDMWISLQQQYKCLSKDGLCCLVVGNSLHGGKHAPYVIATDLLLAQMAKHMGFSVEAVMIARTMKRRLSGNHFLRESVVVLTKS